MRYLCLTLLAGFGLSVSAQAADLPTKAPAAVAAYNWTGFYIGANAGYGWHDPTVTFTGNDPVSIAGTCGGSNGGTCVPPTAFNINGWLGGLQAGYNWQLSPKTLVGVETDFDFSRIRGTGVSNFFLGAAPAAASSFTAEQNVKWFGTVRGRFGYLPADRLLAYVTGGLAYGRVERSATLDSRLFANLNSGGFGYNCVPGPGCFLGSSSRVAVGWTAGGGVEYAAWNNFTVKAEYLYVNLGNGNNVNSAAQLSFSPNLASFTAAYSRVDFHVVRAGINYRF